jgi:CO/xanthine dehydrogenase FAD-binding subunit
VSIVIVPPGLPRTGAPSRAPAPHGLERARLVTPRSIEEAVRTLAEAHRAGQRGLALAGGTDFIVDRHLMDPARATDVDVVVDLTGVDALREVRGFDKDGDSSLLLGGGVTYWMLRTDPRIASRVPMLARMATDVGAVQIQTRGTLAGNLASASPAADGVAALMALDATITIAGEAGTRKVALEGFFTGYRKTVLGPAELIVALEVRVPRPGASVRWQKVGTRLAQAISKVALASVVETDRGVITRARFGMASVAPTTAPLAKARAYLEGRALPKVERKALDLAVAADIKPIDDVRSTGEYRLHVAKALVWRAIHA